jgi:FKBP-type peptidyl-prolyl cis-trans isomerase
MHSRRSFIRHTIAFVLPVLLATACGSDSAPTDPIPPAGASPSTPATETFAAKLGVNISQMTRKSDALYIQDLVVGTGAEATSGKAIRAMYTGWFTNGTTFDSNAGGTPIPVTLGLGQVISGWDQGIVGMRVGGKRRLVIGSALAYGTAGRGKIPPNVTLVFDVELVP